MFTRPSSGNLAPALLCAFFIAALVAPAAHATADAPDPVSVLGYYAQAFNDRDPELIDVLYAEDYVMVVVVPPQAEFIDRASAVDASQNMINDKEVSSLALTFEDGYTVAEGTDAGTWRIEDLRMTVAAEFVEGSRMGVPSHSETGCSTLYVRESATNEGMFEIFREVMFEGVGCEKK